VPTRRKDEWVVAKLSLAPPPKMDAKPEIRADERPPTPDDPADRYRLPSWYGA
jgi:hypothetical protein